MASISQYQGRIKKFNIQIKYNLKYYFLELRSYRNKQPYPLLASG